MRSGKDGLALGNISGAMVFQSMLPVAVGLAFTNWQLGSAAAVAAGAALLGGGLALVAIQRFSRYPLPFMAAWGLLYVGTVVYIITAA